WTSKKQVVRDFISQHDYIALLSFVHPVQPASLLQRQVPNLVVLRFHSHQLAVRSGELAYRAYVVAGEDRRSIADMRRFSFDIEIILIGEQVIAGGTHVSLHNRGTSRKDKHDVVAELGQSTLVAGTKAFAQTDEQQQRSDTPGDAEHR